MVEEHLRFNSSSSLFSCYESVEKQDDIYLYEYSGKKPTTAEQVNSLVNSYYNNGIYTKKSNINISEETKFDLSSVFHGSVKLDRTTYYYGNELLMVDFDGSYDGYNSGYGTDENGNLTHFKVDKNGDKIGTPSFAADKSHTNWNDKSKDGMEGFYVTLNDMLEERRAIEGKYEE